MQSQFEYVRQLISPMTPPIVRRKILEDFAYDFGWHPSNVLELPFVEDIATTHLVVEHGLENTAVISFIEQSKTFSDLNTFDQRRLLSVSYNNLIDWHINIEADAVTYVYNRTKSPTILKYQRFTRDSVDQLRSQVFEQAIGKRPNPNIPALDDALIETISYWKRELVAQIGSHITNGHLSAFFNAIIFVRAIEDQRKRFARQNSQLLLGIWNERIHTPRETITTCLNYLGVYDIPHFLINQNNLKIFDEVDHSTISTLLSEFYRNKFAPYEYDFSLMSKHALSRIYEHYVSVLRLEESNPQMTLPFFSPLPEEERNRAFGSVYTPQFIARFFAKFLHREIPPTKFKSLRVIDPAVGSGIFLRTLLELQFESIGENVSTNQVQHSVSRVYGIDFDENAVRATQLSLSLLHLVLTDELPEELNIFSAESIEYYQEHIGEFRNSFDAVIANPPFVSLDRQERAMSERIAQFMKDYGQGRLDIYLPFLRLGLEMLKPGGYGLFVLPHSFLLSHSAGGMRKYLSQSAYIRCLADLSAIRVFDESDIYIIILIFQKKPSRASKLQPPATIVKCQELVGRALQDVLDGRRIENNFYSIYDVSQEVFSRDEWTIAPPIESKIERKIASLPMLEEFMEIHQGFVSGADDIFIISNKNVPKGEESIYKPYLSDREMLPYIVPNETMRSIFYPYLEGEKITEEQLRDSFPKTWSYLKSKRKLLESRKSLEKYGRAWWEPMWPRPPKNLIRPKIISPHLVLLPRFSLDMSGEYVISRSPLMYPKETGAEQDFLLYFTAILNSTTCYWYISNHSHKYSRGYAMLEVKTLRKTPVPDPTSVPSVVLRELIELVQKRISLADSETLGLENQIDNIVADLYKLTAEEKRTLYVND